MITFLVGLVTAIAVMEAYSCCIQKGAKAHSDATAFWYLVLALGLLLSVAYPVGSLVRPWLAGVLGGGM